MPDLDKLAKRFQKSKATLQVSTSASSTAFACTQVLIACRSLELRV
jgi:hypothetical protein